jgi:hypothetical protein
MSRVIRSAIFQSPSQPVHQPAIEVFAAVHLLVGGMPIPAAARGEPLRKGVQTFRHHRRSTKEPRIEDFLKAEREQSSS